jgi:hypothetical protein
MHQSRKQSVSLENLRRLNDMLNFDIINKKKVCRIVTCITKLINRWIEEQRSQNSSSGTHRRALQIATEKFQKLEPVITQFI